MYSTSKSLFCVFGKNYRRARYLHRRIYIYCVLYTNVYCKYSIKYLRFVIDNSLLLNQPVIANNKPGYLLICDSAVRQGVRLRTEQFPVDARIICPRVDFTSQ